MSFGESILKKYGWSKGKGLGREENGISTFIRPKLKHNLSGVGHNEADEHTFHWWDHVYNKAANSISIKKEETGEVKLVRTGEFKVSTKKSSLNKNKETSTYGNFVKSCVLEGNKVTEYANSLSSKKEKKGEETLELIKNYTDKELFKMCGGLTAHKGARHGLTMSAKLARIEEQEKQFLEKLKTDNQVENEKKRKLNNESAICCNVSDHSDEVSDVENIGEKLSKKKKKKKKRSQIKDDISSKYVPVLDEYRVSSVPDHENSNSKRKHKKKKKKKERLSV